MQNASNSDYIWVTIQITQTASSYWLVRAQIPDQPGSVSRVNETTCIGVPGPWKGQNRILPDPGSCVDRFLLFAGGVLENGYLPRS